MFRAFVLLTLIKSVLLETCGGQLTSKHGFIHTPAFPHPFAVPIVCRWIIDSSSQSLPVSIVVYLSQLFVTTGLTMTEYAYWEEGSTTFQLDPKIVFRATEENAVIASVVATNRSFLVVDFKLDRSEGNHLRGLDNLIDTFGFNLTYVMHPLNESPRRSCSAAKCSMLGHCYASRDFSEFGCSCFDGFSGNSCSFGALCSTDYNPCHNNATCRHVGSKDIACDCRPGFSGALCHRDQLDEDCKQDFKCVKQCNHRKNWSGPCSCEISEGKINKDTSHYECSLRLTTTDVYSSKWQKNLLLKQISRYLKQANLSEFRDVDSLNITNGGEVNFHFVASSSEGEKVRELLMALVDNAQLTNFSFSHSHFSLKLLPTLLIQSISVNKKEPRVSLGSEFTVKCVARGSSKMKFSWFKDGQPINGSISTRKIQTWTNPRDSLDKTVAHLKIENTHSLDEGKYTCQVIDYGLEQCQSIFMTVIQPLNVIVEPISATVHKGSNLTLRCFTSNKPNKQKLGYNWTKNKSLFRMVPGKEFWEDLYPDGSVLNIYNIQKSGTFTCQAVLGVWSGEATSRIDLFDNAIRGDGSRCSEEIPWSATVSGYSATAPCPRSYTGQATRLCLFVQPGRAKWQVADYSQCVSSEASIIINNFIKLTLGIGGTQVKETVFEIATWLNSKKQLYPGEAEPMVHLLADVLNYLNATSNLDCLVNVTDNFFKVVSNILLKESSIVNVETVVQVDTLVRKWSHLWAIHSGGTFNHLVESSLVINTFKFNPLQNAISLKLPKAGFRYPGWIKNTVSISVNNEVTDEATVISVILYKDIAQFFPQHFSQKTTDGKDFDFRVVGPVLSISASSGLEFSLRFTIPTGALCGLTTSGIDWDIESCNSTLIGDSNTLCYCFRGGVYAAIDPEAEKFFNRAELRKASTTLIAGCSSCVIQAAVTFLLLSIRMWRRLSIILFLKLQCTASIAAAMIIFIYTSKETIPQDLHNYLSICLKVLLLMAISTQLAKVVVIYTEILKLPSTRYLKQTAVVILTGLCGVYGLCCIVIADFGSNKTSWWSREGNEIVYVTISYAGAVIFLFVSFGTDLTCKLALTLKKRSKSSRACILRRLGLLKRSAVLLASIVLMVLLSINYANNPTPSTESAFSIASGALGFTLFVCYVIMSENNPVKNTKFIKRFYLLGTDEMYSSSSDKKFFTKEEAEVECSSGVPPDVTPRQSEEILLKPVTDTRAIASGQRKSVSFHSDLVTECTAFDDNSDGSQRKEIQLLTTTTSSPYPSSLRTVGATSPLHSILHRKPGSLDVPSSPPTPPPPPPPPPPHVRIVSAENHNKDVLNRISHDLDYLLDQNKDDSEIQTFF